ncbi:MAG: zinc-dependent metalloprotease [Corynebacterium sp.]|nr:zinc-dependent metalloprotease [Corynebacterium sp.]
MSKGFGFTSNNDDEGPQDPMESLFRMLGNSGGGFVSWSPQEGFTGGGPLGDMLRQFSRMMDNDTSNTPPTLDPELMITGGTGALGKEQGPRSGDAAMVEEAVRLAELWLDEVTDIPTAQAPAEAWSARQWLTRTVPTWVRLGEPIIDSRGAANQDSVPEDAKQMVAPVMKVMNSFSHMQASSSIGASLGEVAAHTITGCDLGLPVLTGTIVVLTEHLREAIADLDVPQQEAVVYIVAREAARQRLFAHAPWIGESLISAVEEYAAGLTIDTSSVDDVLRDVQSGDFDPERIQEALKKLEPKVYTRNDYSTSRFTTLVALIEGWVDHVTHAALMDRIPSTEALEEAWRRRRSAGFTAEHVLAEALDIDLGESTIDQAVDLWKRVEFAVGKQGRDHVFDHPDFLPTAADLAASAEFIDKLLAASTADDDFDPIAEITRLEEEQSE